jgi:hypothetical protein
LTYRTHEGALGAARNSFNAYEEFLKILDDPGLRDGLKKLKVPNAMSDDTFRRAKQIAADFQEGLAKLLFRTDSKLTDVAETYGVF